MKSLPVVSQGNTPAIGARLRSHRLRQHMTIDQLAEATGLTKGFISRVERDQTSPSVATLVALCTALQVEVGSIFEEPETTLVTLNQAPRIDFGGTGINEKLLSAQSLSKIRLTYTEVEPGGSGESELYTVDCETEVVHVLTGTFIVETVNGRYELQAGDTLTFSGKEPHTWRNESNHPVTAIWLLVKS